MSGLLPSHLCEHSVNNVNNSAISHRDSTTPMIVHTMLFSPLIVNINKHFNSKSLDICLLSLPTQSLHPAHTVQGRRRHHGEEGWWTLRSPAGREPEKGETDEVEGAAV